MKHLKDFDALYFDTLYEEVSPNIGIENGSMTVDKLNSLLSNHFILFMKIWNFHWNLVSKRFGPLHKFFNDLYDKFFNDIDGIAERIRMIGGKPIGSLRGYLEKTKLEEFEGEETPKDTKMIEMILSDYETIIKEIREILQGDVDNGTSKYLEDLIEAHEKDAWMLRSYLTEK